MKQRARELRRAMTPADAILWRHLRGRRFANFKFRRQQVVGPYIVDFFCSRVKVVIEIDGESHLGEEVADGKRQEWFERQGYHVLRFWNTQVYDEEDGVLELIWQDCDARKGRPLTPNPSPPEGRGE